MQGIRTIQLQKGLTRYELHKFVDNLGEIRYAIRYSGYGGLEEVTCSAEVTREELNGWYKKLLKDGYKVIWDYSAPEKYVRLAMARQKMQIGG